MLTGTKREAKKASDDTIIHYCLMLSYLANVANAASKGVAHNTVCLDLIDKILAVLQTSKVTCASALCVENLDQYIKDRADLDLFLDSFSHVDLKFVDQPFITCIYRCG